MPTLLPVPLPCRIRRKVETTGLLADLAADAVPDPDLTASEIARQTGSTLEQVQKAEQQARADYRSIYGIPPELAY